MEENVSRFGTGTQVISSEYFNIKYRPNEPDNFELGIEASTFLVYLAIADARFTEENYENVYDKYLELINLCKSQQELKNLDTFFKEAAKVGGIAVDFYESIEEFLKNKIDLFQQVPPKIESTRTAPSNEDRVAELKKVFFEKWETLKSEYKKMFSDKYLDEDEMYYMLNQLNNLETDLYQLEKYSNNNEFYEISNAIKLMKSKINRIFEASDKAQDLIRGL